MSIGGRYMQRRWEGRSQALCREMQNSVDLFARDGEFQDLELASAWWQAFMDWMESALQAQAWEFPQRVKSAEPFQQGNILQGRLQAVGPPSQLIVIGSG